MKNLKLLVGSLALAATFTTFGTNVYAAEGTKDAEVTYNNSSDIPDPENPDNPDWAVNIPSSIQFTDDTKKVDASVELVAKNGGTLPTGDVTVTVESTNAYKLSIGGDGTTDIMPYVLQYNGTTMTAVVKTVATLNAGNTKQTGEAVLKGTATKTGSHTDTLTYKVSYTK